MKSETWKCNIIILERNISSSPPTKHPRWGLVLILIFKFSFLGPKTNPLQPLQHHKNFDTWQAGFFSRPEFSSARWWLYKRCFLILRNMATTVVKVFGLLLLFVDVDEGGTMYTSQATRPRISGLVIKKQFFLKFLVYSGFLRSSPGIYGLVRVFTVKSGFRLWRTRMSTKFGNLRSIYGENCDKFLVGFRQFLVNFRLFSAYLWVDQFFGLFRLFCPNT